MSFSIASLIACTTILFSSVLFAERDKLIISTLDSIAYSIAAYISEALPWPDSSNALIDKIFALGFSSLIYLYIWVPWPLSSEASSPITDMLSTRSLALIPVSITAIVLLGVFMESRSLSIDKASSPWLISDKSAWSDSVVSFTKSSSAVLKVLLVETKSALL